MSGLALIINTANQPGYLRRVLDAVARQSSLPEEVLLADDGSGEETRQVFARWAAGLPEVRAEHVWQQNEGFRRARILNQAIAATRSEYLLFLDGDTIPHPKFVADHRRLRRDKAFLQGHRVLVQEAAALWFGRNGFERDRRHALWQHQLAGVKHAYRWPFPLIRARTDLRGVRGCNLALWREHLLAVNGYNEDFVGWGREDSELALRLMNSGIERLDVRGWAVCYHLWHPPASRAALPANDQLLAEAERNGATLCEHGLDQYLNRR